MSRYHFIKINSSPTRIYTNSIASERPRYICFKKLANAVTFKEYIASYRANFGEWPKFGDHGSSLKVRLIDKPMKPDDIDLEIESKRFDELVVIGTTSGVGFSIFESFTINDKFSIQFSLNNLNIDVDEDIYTDWLEDIVKK